MNSRKLSKSAKSTNVSESKTSSVSTSKIPEMRLDFGRTKDISTAEAAVRDYLEKCMESFNPDAKKQAEWKPVWANRFSNTATDLDKGMFNLGLVNGYQCTIKKSGTDTILGKYSYRFDWDEDEGMHINLKYQHFADPVKGKVAQTPKSKDKKTQQQILPFDLFEHNFVYSFDLNRMVTTPTVQSSSRSSPFQQRATTPSKDESKHSSSSTPTSERQDDQGRKSILRIMLEFTRKALEAKEYMPASDATAILRLFENEKLSVGKKHFQRFGELLRPLLQAAYQESNERNAFENPNAIYDRVTRYLKEIWEQMQGNDDKPDVLGVFASECLYVMDPNPLNIIQNNAAEEKKHGDELLAVKHDQEKVLHLISEYFALKPSKVVKEFFEGDNKEFFEGRPAKEFTAVQSVMNQLERAPTPTNKEEKEKMDKENSNTPYNNSPRPTVRFMNDPSATKQKELTRITITNPGKNKSNPKQK